MAKRLDILVPLSSTKGKALPDSVPWRATLPAQVRERFDLDTRFIFIDDEQHG